MNQLSKDQIKNRLLKRAAKHWGYSDVELENVFDPIVNLLFDVCSKELEKISHEIFSSRRRITERLIDILTPTEAIKATPARGILKAYPVENEITLNDYNQFYFQKKEANSLISGNLNETKYFHFGPTVPVKLNRNKVRHLVLPNGVQNCENDKFKEIVSSKNYLEPQKHGTIWISIEHEGDGVINDLMFYFYLKNMENSDVFYNFLPQAKWFLNTTQLSVKKGYNNTESYKKNDIGLIKQDFFHLNKTQELINEYYFNNFLTINDSITLNNESFEVPNEFKTFIPKEELVKLSQEKLIWFRVEFSNVIGPNFLSEIYCNNNCFPVINKKLNEIQGKIKDILNIYPLSLNDEYFLELFSVLNDNNKEIEIINDNSDTANEEYAYLRFGGIARFDERNANEEIIYLIDLIRDEASAFSRLGNSFTDNNLKDINQIITRFKNKIAEIGTKNNTNPYLVLNNSDKDNTKGNLFVKYWTTLGEEANKINMFSKFRPVKGADFVNDSIVLLSTTKGGKNELTNSEKIYAYRENLISKNRVVTRQDIVILCKNYFKETIGKIEIKNGIQSSLDSNIGYEPTIDIFIERKDLNHFNEEEWQFLKEDLKLLIESRSINIVPFRLIYN